MKRLKALLCYDGKQGLRTEGLKYLFLFLLALAGGWEFGREYLPYLEYDIVTHKASVWDYLAHDFWGLPPLSRQRTLTSAMPMLWLLIMILITLILGYYLYEQSFGFGRNILLKGGSRIRWWLSKCLWCVLGVVLALLALLAGSLCCGILQGISFSGVNWDILELAKGLIGFPKSGVESILLVVILPLLTMTAIALWQQVLSLLVQPLVATLVTVGYYLAASFYRSPFLIANYAILCRNEYAMEHGWTLAEGLTVSLTACVLAVLAGAVIVKKKDFLQKI